MNKEEIKRTEKNLSDLTAKFCETYLNEEYQGLCKRLIEKMGRKKEVPFKRGKIEIWAAAVVYAIGSINFLFDKSFEPYITSETIHKHFGTKSSTVSAKAAQIKNMFNIWHYDPEFSTSGMTASNPFNDIVSVDGFLVPISTLPEEMQIMVRNARAEGNDIEFTTRRD